MLQQTGWGETCWSGYNRVLSKELTWVSLDQLSGDALFRAGDVTQCLPYVTKVLGIIKKKMRTKRTRRKERGDGRRKRFYLVTLCGFSLKDKPMSRKRLLSSHRTVIKRQNIKVGEDVNSNALGPELSEGLAGLKLGVYHSSSFLILIITSQK